LSKIYEAVKKAAEEREHTRGRTVQPAASVHDGVRYGGGAEEDYQKLRASLVSIPLPSALRTIVLTSPRHGEGTTTVAVGLATALAKERDARVLLVEGNFRSPSLSSVLHLPSTVGVPDFAAGRATPEALATRLEQLNLSVITAGASAIPDTNFEIVEVLVARIVSGPHRLSSRQNISHFSFWFSVAASTTSPQSFRSATARLGLTRDMTASAAS
jgi:Mrp family chromosome partitioning ATPase